MIPRAIGLSNESLSQFMTAVNRQPWMKRGVCTTVDPDLFFPAHDAAWAGRAKRICLTCPVRMPCLEYALSLGENPAGVWGATTESDRQQIRKRRAQKAKTA